MHNHDHKEHLAELTAGIVSAYLNKNVVSPAALVSLIESVRETLSRLDGVRSPSGPEKNVSSEKREEDGEP
ncbi:putative transcriptional regulator [Rhizobium flavum]|uniref:Putative transcriptional regulator n=1 Tax=Pseudorhizobium flavum TaxID=1335061 RepID=A0A7W9Z1N7_9HYPH|nr:putative transcriptional regulator [Pseudorhizobium flavum]CAD6599257.1 hypothetical protein RFYW14_00657 [Pseudorhizobium flavum]